MDNLRLSILDVEAMNQSGLWLQGLNNLLAKFLETQGSPVGGGLPVADHAKGAILTLAITDALEVGPGAC